MDADGAPAPKALERARRDLLKRGDAKGLEDLLERAARLEDSEDLVYAIRQNLRFLALKAEPAPVLKGTPPSAPERGRGFLFGDPRRPRSLAAALIASLATFPAAWGVLLILYGLGGDNSYGDQSQRHAGHVIVLLAAILPTIGLVAAPLDWFGARRRYPPESRTAVVSAEGVISAVSVLAVFVAMFALGAVLWNVLV